MGILNLYFFASDRDLARVFGIGATKNFHESGFACTVLTDQGHNLSGIGRETYIVQCFYPGKLF